MAPKILFFGTGSIGGTYAVILSRAVPAADITVICRSNFDAVSESGLTLHSTVWGRDLHAKPSVARNVTDAVQMSAGAPFDYILVTSKALPTTPSTPELIKPAVSRETTIVLIQNGINTEAPYAELFPENPILSTVAYLPATQIQAGIIEHCEVELLHIGAYPASAPAPHKAAASAFAGLLARAGASAQLHDDVQRERWSKLLVNASWNALCALTRCRDRQLLDLRTPAAGAFAGLVRSVMLEIAAAARAHGHAAVDAALVDGQLQRAARRGLPGIQPSMMADALAGRNMEVEAIVGNTLRLAREKGVATPALQTIYFLAAGLDRSFTLSRL